MNGYIFRRQIGSTGYVLEWKAEDPTLTSGKPVHPAHPSLRQSRTRHILQVPDWRSQSRRFFVEFR